MNKSKTTLMMENDTPIYVSNTQIENQDREIQRRITVRWRAFAKHIFKGNTGTCLKRQVYNSCVLPAITYGAKT